jgi:poly(A) polymerase
MNEKRFRAAYDFLLLRAIEEPELQELADWWTTLQEVDADERAAMVRAGKGKGRSGRKRRQPRRRKAAS